MSSIPRPFPHSTRILRERTASLRHSSWLAPQTSGHAPMAASQPAQPRQRSTPAGRTPAARLHAGRLGDLERQWEFEFDDRDAGLRERWFAGTHPFTKPIVVPYTFQSKLSGIGDTAFHDVVWYRRTFAVPDGWQGRRVLLNFGAVDYEADVWVNGRGRRARIAGATRASHSTSPIA